MVDLVLQVQKVHKETRVTLVNWDPLVLLEMMGSMETVAQLDQRVKKESQEIKVDLDQEAHLELKDRKEILGLLVSQAPLENKDLGERKETGAYRVILDLLDSLAFKDLLENLEWPDHLASKEMLDNLESRETLDLLGLLVFKGLLETKVHQDLRDHLV